jgi:hypothetical protein
MAARFGLIARIIEVHQRRIPHDKVLPEYSAGSSSGYRKCLFETTIHKNQVQKLRPPRRASLKYKHRSKKLVKRFFSVFEIRSG